MSKQKEKVAVYVPEETDDLVELADSINKIWSRILPILDSNSIFEQEREFIKTAKYITPESGFGIYVRFGYWQVGHEDDEFDKSIYKIKGDICKSIVKEHFDLYKINNTFAMVSRKRISRGAIPKELTAYDLQSFTLEPRSICDEGELAYTQFWGTALCLNKFNQDDLLIHDFKLIGNDFDYESLKVWISERKDFKEEYKMKKETIMDKKFQEVVCNEVDGLYLSDYWFDLNKVSIIDFDPSCMRYVAIIDENEGRYTLKISEGVLSLYKFNVNDLRIIFTKDKNVLSLTSKNNSLYLSDVSISTKFTNMDEIQKRYNEDIVVDIRTSYNSSSKLLSKLVRKLVENEATAFSLLTENGGHLTMIIQTTLLPMATPTFPSPMAGNQFHQLPVVDTKYSTTAIKDIFLRSSDDDESSIIYISLSDTIYYSIVAFLKQWLKYEISSIDNEDMFRFRVDGMKAIRYDIGACNYIYFVEPKDGLLTVAIINNDKLLFATILNEKRIQELLHITPDRFNKYSYIQY